MQRTRTAFLLTRLLRAPLWAIYSLLPFIMYKDLGATPFQIALLIMLKPSAALLSVYWSAHIQERPDRLRANLIGAGILAVLPFFAFPFVSNPWFFIGASGVYMILKRGVIPTWMEIFKLNLTHTSRQKVFAYGSALGYIGDAALPFIIGPLLDHYVEAWRWLFPLSAVISLIPLIWQYRIPIPAVLLKKHVTVPFKELVKRPWVNAWNLVKKRPEFGRFQVGFMLGGAGLMVMQPALPQFFMSDLGITYTELAIALTLCKGIGFALTSPFWARIMNGVDIYRFSSYVTVLAALFPFCVIAAQWNLSWLFIAYIGYGIMQAGSELSWNLSGPIFAGNEDSSVYSSVNVLTVGLRGAVAPALGGYLCTFVHPPFVMVFGGILCLLATVRMLQYSERDGVHVLQPES